MFNASQFTATQHSTAEDKAKFANQFVKFVQSDFRSKEFPIWFYQRLSMTFGHIAYYDRGGFFHTFFDDQEGKLEFIDTTLGYPCYGDPAWTFCDVEKEIQVWMIEENIRQTYATRASAGQESAERLELARLQKKYGGAA